MVQKLQLIVPGASFSSVGLGLMPSPYNPYTDSSITLLGAWDADDPSTYTVDGSNNILTFPSKVNGFTLSPESGTSVKAVLQPNGWGSNGNNPVQSSQNAAFLFTGGGNLASSVYKGIGPLSATGITVFALTQRGTQYPTQSGNKSIRPMFWGPVYTNGGGAYLAGWLGVATPTLDASQNIFTAGQASSSITGNAEASPWAIGAQAVVGAQFGPSGSAVDLNGTGFGSSTAYNVTTTEASWLLGGGDNANDLAFAGLIKVLIVAEGVLTTSQLQKLEGYLAWRGGIQSQLPTSHPYYSSGP